jgi:hypothetical protein
VTNHDLAVSDLEKHIRKHLFVITKHFRTRDFGCLFGVTATAMSVEQS